MGNFQSYIYIISLYKKFNFFLKSAIHAGLQDFLIGNGFVYGNIVMLFFYSVVI